MTTHYHVAYGIAGYGPAASDAEMEYAAQVIDLPALIREKLADIIGGAAEDARGYADSRDFESAWKTAQLADTFETLRANLDPARADAPLYRGNPQAWAETIQVLLANTLPLALDIAGRNNLYVWTCEEACDPAA